MGDVAANSASLVLVTAPLECAETGQIYTHVLSVDVDYRYKCGIVLTRSGQRLILPLLHRLGIPAILCFRRTARRAGWH